MIGISLCIWLACLIHTYSSQEIDINVNITQLFVYKISPEMLNWNDKERGNYFHSTVTSMEGPDVPPWLYVKYIKKNNYLYIFGAPPKDLKEELLELQISITSLESYRIKSFKLKIWFNSIDGKKCDNNFSNTIRTWLPMATYYYFTTEYAKYEVRLRIRNVDIEEMLNKTRQINLISIFEENFWKASKGKLYITFMTSSDSVGYQLPLNPNDTAGVMIHLGSAANFSEELFSLQNETMPLAKHCPSSDKRSTVERFFRPKGFIVDWCSFRLVTLNECEESLLPEFVSKNDCNILQNNIADSTLRTNKEFLILNENLPKSPLHGVIPLSVILSSVFLVLIFTFWLFSLMCFNNKKLDDPSSDDYFDTIFFICEDSMRKRQATEEPECQNGESNNEVLFPF